MAVSGVVHAQEAEVVAPAERSAYRLHVLAMPFLAYSFNFIDRILVGILAPPIKQDLGVSDAQLGLMSGTAPSYSLIADCFPPGLRARAYAIYAFGVPVGTAAGLILGGVLASLVDWRTAFFTVEFADQHHCIRDRHRLPDPCELPPRPGVGRLIGHPAWRPSSCA